MLNRRHGDQQQRERVEGQGRRGQRCRVPGSANTPAATTTQRPCRQLQLLRQPDTQQLRRKPAEEGVRRDHGRGQDGAPAPVAQHHDAHSRSVMAAPTHGRRQGTERPAQVHRQHLRQVLGVHGQDRERGEQQGVEGQAGEDGHRGAR